MPNYELQPLPPGDDEPRPSPYVHASPVALEVGAEVLGPDANWWRLMAAGEPTLGDVVGAFSVATAMPFILAINGAQLTLYRNDAQTLLAFAARTQQAPGADELMSALEDLLQGRAETVHLASAALARLVVAGDEAVNENRASAPLIATVQRAKVV
jgi:hypothetical protein